MALSWRVGAYLVLIAVVYISNGELMQHLGAGHISPLLMLWLCHLGGLLFVPPLLLSYAPQVRAIVDRPFVAGICVLSALLMLYNYAWLAAAAALPVAIDNLVFQTSIAFTYVAATSVGVERPSVPGVAAVLLALAGVVLATGPHLAGAAPLPGVLLALLAAAGNSAYQLCWRGFFGGRVGNAVLYACCGAGVAVCHVAFAPVLAAAGAFAHLPAVADLPLVALASLAAFLVNALTVLVIAEAGPVALAVGSTLSVPVGFVLDWVVHREGVQATQVVASAAIMAAVVMLTAKPRDVLPHAKLGYADDRPLPGLANRFP